MRRILAAIGALALLATLPGGAAAAPYREVDRVRDAGCSGLVTPRGVLDFSGYVSDLYGTDAWLELWAGEPYESETVLTRDWDQPASVTFSGDEVTMSIPVLPRGAVTVAGTLTPVDSSEWDDRFREGNSTYRSSGSGTLYALTGSVILPGDDEAVALDPLVCSGGDTTWETFMSQPRAKVITLGGLGGLCELANADGDTGEAFVGGGDGVLFLDGRVLDASGAEIFFFGEGPIDASGGGAIPLTEYDAETGAQTGTGVAQVTLAGTGETFSYTLKASNGFQRTSGSLLDVEGSLATSLGSFSLDGCVASVSESKRVETVTSGPKPGGKRPANDLASGAIILKPGGRATVATRGAQQRAEADYPCLAFTDPFDGTSSSPAAEHTVWYRIAGTGDPMTFDTAGSDFDTVIAVYEGSPTGAVVACVDDTPLQPVGRTLQGAATFPTLAGTSYWVQVGGLNEEPVFGPDPYVPYGTLKVSVAAP